MPDETVVFLRISDWFDQSEDPNRSARDLITLYLEGPFWSKCELTQGRVRLFTNDDVNNWLVENRLSVHKEEVGMQVFYTIKTTAGWIRNNFPDLIGFMELETSSSHWDKYGWI